MYLVSLMRDKSHVFPAIWYCSRVISTDCVRDYQETRPHKADKRRNIACMQFCLDDDMTTLLILKGHYIASIQSDRMRQYRWSYKWKTYTRYLFTVDPIVDNSIQNKYTRHIDRKYNYFYLILSFSGQV